MNRESLTKVVESHCHRIKQASYSVNTSFDEKVIHDFRVEYKKLRAFLRMIITGNAIDNTIYPQSFKELYQSAGSIRNVQILRKKLKSVHVKPELLPVFDHFLYDKEDEAKQAFARSFASQDWENTLAQWKGILPVYLTNSMIDKFVRYKITGIRIAFLDPYEDENLHSIRKHLKDIIYNIRLFDKAWGIPFPVSLWTDVPLLFQTTETLGEFNDETTAIHFLENNCEHLPTEEKEQLANAYEKWKIEKADIFHSLIELIPSLQLQLPKR